MVQAVSSKTKTKFNGATRLNDLPMLFLFHLKKYALHRHQANLETPVVYAQGKMSADDLQKWNRSQKSKSKPENNKPQLTLCMRCIHYSGNFLNSRIDA